ncbi:MAG TPA: alpha/beta hydrolase family protein [Abditibacteriaceae bacterium]
MAFCELKYFSPALGKATAANVILPEGQKGPFAVFYLLHGLSDDHSIWQRRTSLERYVANLPLIVVMPDGGRSFYCDAVEGAAYETAIVRDLVNYVDTVFNTRAEREGRCIGGLSMGGYGAVKLALKFPEMFASANSHSGALGFGHMKANPRDALTAEFMRIVGKNPKGGDNDCHALAEKLKGKRKRPALRIDCGVDDFLIEHNRGFVADLNKLNYKHEYEEFAGGHSWEYWDEHVQEAIAFHARNLGLVQE